MRVVALACTFAILAQGALARDVALRLDWPEGTAPAAELIAVARDASGTVLDTHRVDLPADTRATTLSLPSLSRQASSVQIGALRDGAFVLQSARAPVDGGQPPDQMRLTAALTASFRTAFLCASGNVVALEPDGDGFRLSGQRFAPAEAGESFIAPDGTTANRATGPLRLESESGALLNICQPIPARPLLPLTALGPEGAWQVRIASDGARLRIGTPPPDAGAPDPVATTIARPEDTLFRFTMGVRVLLVRRRACQLAGLIMPFPFTAQLSTPDDSVPLGCAGDPLRALEGPAWQVTHLFGRAVPRSVDEASAFALQLDTGRISGRTSCNRFLGAVRVEEGRLQVDALGTTRLSCPANLSNLEMRFLDALEAADGILRLPDGAVALYAGATAVLVLQRSD